MTQLVKLRTRPSRNGERYSFCLEYKDQDGKRIRRSLGHADKRKAEQQRVQCERELRMGTVARGSLTLSEFIKDSLCQSRGQLREGTLEEYRSCYQDFLDNLGKVDLQTITLRHGERYIQACLDRGNSPATAAKKVRELKRLFQLGLERGQLEENPFRFLKPPKCPNKPVCVHSGDECRRVLEAAVQLQGRFGLNWVLLLQLTFSTGLREFEVMQMAGHSSFETTRRFYMGIDRSLLERTRQANDRVLAAIFGTHLARAPETT